MAEIVMEGSGKYPCGQASDKDNSIVLQNEAKAIVAYSDAIVLIATLELLQILDVLQCGGLLNLCYGVPNASP
jgi:hypothetical protein